MQDSSVGTQLRADVDAGFIESFSWETDPRILTNEFDFLQAVQDSSTGTQLTADVAGLMDTWTKQMGYPVITLTRNGNHVTARQDRFLLYSKSTIKEEFKSPYGLVQ